MSTKLNVLLIEDNPGDARIIRELLAAEDALRFRLQIADHLAAGLAELAAGGVDVLLLDLSLPDSQGLDSFTAAHGRFPDVPIIVLTGLDDEKLAEEAVRAGAQDYLVKGQVEGHLLARAMRYAVERRQAEAALRASELRFRTLSENALTGIYIVQDGVLAYVNRTLAQIFGYETGELIGADPLVVIHPDDQALVTENLRRRFAGEIESVQYEFRGRSKTGEIKHIEVLGARVELNQRPAVIGNILDITARKQAEERLRASETHYRDLFENASLAIFQSALDGEIITVNSAFARMFGYQSAEELKTTVGNAADLFVDPQRRAEILRLRNEDPARGTFESVYRRKDRSTFIGQLTVKSINDANGRFDYLEGFVEDITERRRAEEALRESEERFRVIFENASEAIHFANADDQILAVNPRMCVLVGYSREELLAMRVPELIAPEARPAGRVIAEEFARHGSAVFVATDLHRDGRRIPVEISVGRIARPSGDLYVSILRDVTERRQAEERIQQQLHELQRWYSVTLDRESRTLELKHEVNELLRRAGEPIRYPSAEQ